MSARFAFSAKIWRSTAGAGWFFLTLPEAQTMPIKTRALGHMKSFGSLRVTAKIGTTTWNTSIFFDTKAGAFVLPVKTDIRQKESIALGDTVKCAIEFQT
ncbi:MAG: DUF1905 domain-containing protein [Terricaulis sp.]